MSVDTSPVETLATWPSVRQVCRQLDIAQPYAWRLVRAGRLRGVKTALGWLLSPESVAEFAAQRPARPQSTRWGA